MTDEKMPEEESSGKKPSVGSELLDILRTVLLTAAVVLFLNHFVVGTARTVGQSMEPTLDNGDLMLVWRLGYHPEQGDVVIARREQDDKIIVKRVIATGGQHIEIDYDNGQVRVDGQVLDEPYIKEAMVPLHWSYLTELDVPEGQVFLMGDNRNNSGDSRDPELGAVPEENLKGHCVCVFFPFSHFQLLG